MVAKGYLALAFCTIIKVSFLATLCLIRAIKVTSTDRHLYSHRYIIFARNNTDGKIEMIGLFQSYLFLNYY